jgi:hypothetical protein
MATTSLTSSLLPDERSFSDALSSATSTVARLADGPRQSLSEACSRLLSVRTELAQLHLTTPSVAEAQRYLAEASACLVLSFVARQGEWKAQRIRLGELTARLALYDEDGSAEPETRRTLLCELEALVRKLLPSSADEAELDSRYLELTRDIERLRVLLCHPPMASDEQLSHIKIMRSIASTSLLSDEARSGRA